MTQIQNLYSVMVLMAVESRFTDVNRDLPVLLDFNQRRSSLQIKQIPVQILNLKGKNGKMAFNVSFKIKEDKKTPLKMKLRKK